MTAQLDIGPLSWVKGEIDLALDRAGAALHDPAGANLKAASGHLHQAHGALAIVGLDGLSEYSGALERLFEALAAGKVADTEAAVAAARNGLDALRSYLDGLMGGEPNQPLKLFPAYAPVVVAAGGQAPSPAALFFPDLTQRPPKRDIEPPALDPAKLAARLKVARTGFERGLLKWIKGDAKGIADMRAAISAIEASRVQPADRAFWWVTLGFIAALGANALPDPLNAKRLALAIGVEVRRLLGGRGQPNDRLLAAVLYQVGVAKGGGIAVEVVRAAYRLAEQLPQAVDVERSGLRPQVLRLRELIGGAKDDWNRLCAGTAAALPPFHDRSTQIAERAEALGQPDLSRLLGALAELAGALRRDPSRHNDAMALEVATALLLADNALENFDAVCANAGDFAVQAGAVVQRLNALLAGEELGELEIPHLDAMSRRAQERLLLATVAREIVSNLGQAEQLLDAFFRAPDRAETRAALSGASRPLKQVEGALAVLGQMRACEVLRDCEAQVARLAGSDLSDPAVFEDLAGKLSALGFFVEQLELGQEPDIDALLSPQAASEPAPPAEPKGGTEFDAAVDELLQTGSAPAAPVSAPEPSAESTRLAGASSEEVDAELLSIFLEEAAEVLATIGEGLPQIHAEPADIDTLTVLRRSAHTLKGSGRMVGLTEFGESAWGVEQVLNKWLQSGDPASPELLAMLDAASALFRDWVAALADRTHRYPDPAPLAAQCATLLAEPEPVAAQQPEQAPEAEPPAAPEETAEAAEAAEAAFAAAPLAEPVPADEAPAEVPAAEPTAVDLVAEIEAREQERMRAEADAAEIAAMEAMAAFDASQTEAPAASPATPMVSLDDIASFDLDLPGHPAQADAPSADDVIPPEPALPDAEIGESPEPSEPGEAPADAAPAGNVVDFPAPPPVIIGDVAVSPALYAIFMEEARGHLAALQADIGHDGPPGNEVIRAAHTLGSIAGTTGIDAIHRLSRALELGLGRLAVAAAAPSDSQRFTFARAVGALEGMLGAVANQRLPGAEAALTAELEAMQPPAIPEPAAPEEAPPAAAAMARGEEAPPPEPAEERRAQRIQDDIDVQVLPLFLEESTELMQSIGSGLRAWRGSPDDGEIARKLQRDLHTLKGSARMAGAMSCGELLHSMESRIEQAVALQAVTPETLDGLETSNDRAAMLIDRLRRGEFAAPEAPAPAGAGAVEIDTGEETPAGQDAAEAAAAPAAAAAPVPAAQVQQTHLRVRADLIDRLVNEAGEVAIARGRIEGEMRALKGSLLELTQNVIRLRGQLREIEIQAESQMQTQMSQMQAMAERDGTEFDPLEFDRFTRFQELTRMMAESVNDVSTVQHTLLSNLDGANASIAAQARLNRELSQRLMSVRMVPFETLAERLHRVVRQAAKDAGKRANLDIRAGQTGMDRSVLEKISAPLEHLLRNAVAHGIELPADRQSAGKDAFGQITLALAQEGNEIVLALADDGRGLDFERIRRRAVERGLIAEDLIMDERQLASLIFQSGFSTAETVTELSGRGVGMDVVRNEIEGLGGRVTIDSVPGQGSTFRLYLPLTLAVTQVVIIESAGHRYAIPSSMVEQAQEMKPDVIGAIRTGGTADWLAHSYPYHYLPRLMGRPDAQPEPARRHWLMMIKGGADRVAIEIDKLLGNQEIVVKAIGPQLARVPGITGATVLGNGEIALILNPIALAARLATGSGHGAGHEVPAPAAPTAPVSVTAPNLTDTQIQRRSLPQGCIMVVDDSLTVRKITGRLLGRQGYHVVTAKDGVDALEQVSELRPDVMLVDIEMPRMDGFELTRTIRADAKLRDIPIIMITSRSADKHRQYAREIGVNHYLGKPYDEDQLLKLVAGFLANREFSA